MNSSVEAHTPLSAAPNVQNCQSEVRLPLLRPQLEGSSPDPKLILPSRESLSGATVNRTVRCAARHAPRPSRLYSVRLATIHHATSQIVAWMVWVEIAISPTEPKLPGRCGLSFGLPWKRRQIARTSATYLISRTVVYHALGPFPLWSAPSRDWRALSVSLVDARSPPDGLADDQL